MELDFADAGLLPLDLYMGENILKTEEYETYKNGEKVSFKVAWASNMPESSDIRLIGKKKGIYLPYSNLDINQRFENVCEDILNEISTSSVTS
ncbi:MAG: hypothetical protein SOW78_04275 [Clostridia bacterium]|nr:hypothetical protein [Clostridia bacterium]